MAEEPILQQDLRQKAPDHHHPIWLWLLFREPPKRPEPQAFQEALSKRLGQVDIVTQNEGSEDGLYSFAAREYPVEYQDGKLPAQLLLGKAEPFDPDSLSEMERSQLWDVTDSGEFLAQCRYQLPISDFMASGLPYKDRCRLLTHWLETAFALFPTAVGVWAPSSGKLMDRERLLANPLEGDGRFLWFGVNVRLFNIQGSDDKVMDTLGMQAIGLPDVQLHFSGIEPNLLTNYLYNVASYLYDNNVPIKSGETIDGIDSHGNIVQDIQWICQYERALIQPARGVLNIRPGRFAAGKYNDPNTSHPKKY